MAFHNKIFDDGYEKMKQWFESKPSYIFVENEETSLQRDRFVQCLKDVGGLRGLNIELKAIENIYYAQELRELFDKNKDEEVDNDEVIDGLNRIAINYMLKNAEIQKRVNAYVIIKLYCAEMEIQNYSYITEDMCFEAQMFLGKFGDNDIRNKVNSPRDFERPSRANLFRSKSLTSSELDKSKEDIDVNLSADTIDKINSSFAKLFGRHDWYSYDYLDKRDCIVEFWDLLDTSNEKVMSKQKLIERFQILALNWMANDEICQEMANTYLQRKIEHAIFVVNNVDPLNQDRELPQFYPKTFATLIDNTGKSHKVCVHEYDYDTESYNVVFENGDRRAVHQNSLTKLERSTSVEEDNFSDLIDNRHITQEYALATAITRHEQNDLILPDVKPENFYIFFGEARMNFERYDYSITYNEFMTCQHIGEDLSVFDECPSAKESCRCFFLHLGVAVNVHPFLLQLQFRQACRSLLSESTASERFIFFSDAAQTVLSPGRFVDFSILSAVWPEPLKNCRILLVTFQSERRHGPASFNSCVTITPENGPWKTDPLTNEYISEDNGMGPERVFMGKDIILKLQDSHFSILKPHFDHENNTVEWDRERPIDTIRRSMNYHNAINEGSNQVALVEMSVGPYLV